MPSLADSLSSIPFYGAYRQRQAEIRQEDSDNLKNAAGAVSLAELLRKATEQQGLRQALANGDTKALMSTPDGISILSHLADLKAKQNMAALGDSFNSAGPMSPEQLDALGYKLAVGGHPGASTIMNIADNRRKQAAAVSQQQNIVSQIQPITETPTMGVGQSGAVGMRSIIPQDASAGQIPPEVQAAIASGKPFSIGVGQPLQPETQKVGGLFSALMDSPFPFIAQEAKRLQAQADKSDPRVIPPSFWETRAENLAKMQFSAQQRADNRPPTPVKVAIDPKTGRAVYTPIDEIARLEPPEKPVRPAATRPDPQIDRFYREYTNDPQVKEANDMEVRIEPLVNYMIDFKKTGKSVGAYDAALTKTYIAATTSIGNRAYAMDWKTIAKLPDLGDRLGNIVSSFIAGKDLTDRTRTEMFNYIKNRYQALDKARTDKKSEIVRRAQANEISENQIFGAAQ